MSDIDFLTFADKNKRISMSASFGINEIPNELKKYYRDRLMDFKSISVREANGKKIIKELTGRDDVYVLLDPTMLIPTEKWYEIMKKPKKWDKLKNKKYIFSFFLRMQDEVPIEIQRIAEKYGCEIINIKNEKDLFYESGPSEFLFLINNAFLICTNSFHASVFSVLFNKPFVFLKSRSEMNSRLETLFNNFNLNNRWFNGEIQQDQLNAEYKTDKILKEERKKAQEFIKMAIK